MRKKVPVNFSSWEKPRKLDAVKINTFTVMFDILSILFQNVAVDIHKIVMIHSNLPMAAPCSHLH